MQSQNLEILSDLLKGERITGLEAWVKYGSSALHSRISDLRNKMGVPVQSVRVEVVGKGGKLKSVCQYYLEPSYINERLKEVA